MQPAFVNDGLFVVSIDCEAETVYGGSYACWHVIWQRMMTSQLRWKRLIKVLV
jgi:hypothetical protein